MGCVCETVVQHSTFAAPAGGRPFHLSKLLRMMVCCHQAVWQQAPMWHIQELGFRVKGGQGGIFVGQA